MVVSALRLTGRWLQSRTHRRAIETWRHYRRLFRWRADRLDPEQRAEVRQALDHLWQMLLGSDSPETVRAARETLTQTGARCFPQSRHHRVRDGLEVFWVTVLVVLALRTFFAMPTVIPTGSMQPTLYGIMVENLPSTNAAHTVRGTLSRGINRILFGREHYFVVARAAGRLEEIRAPEPLLPWLRLPGLTRQRFRVGEEWYALTPAPENLPNPTGMPEEQLFFAYAGIDPRRVYELGEILINTVVTSGDHVLVDRFSYHWRRPRRGEILVFQPRGMEELEDDTYFIKRLVGLPGERVRIGDDRRVWIDGQPLDRDTRGFRKLYGFEGIPAENTYSGHLNEAVARRYQRSARGLAPLFRNGAVERRVPEDALFLLGDNSFSSLDSRRWGSLPEEQVVGRAWCVYWPLSPRTGFGFE